MHAFAVYFFFSVAVMGLSMVVKKVVHTPHDHWFTLLTAVGVGMSWLAGFNMWAAWGVSLRYPWVGVTLSGFALGATGFFLHELLGSVTGLHRKLEDQADVIEMHELHKAA